MRKTVKNILLAINYGVTVAICLLLIISQQFAIFEKALIGFGAIALGMLIRRVINWVSP
jgi:F0F1-type ATP synthase assembly protein I